MIASSSKRIIATSSSSNTVLLWNTLKGEVSRRIEFEGSCVRPLAISADEELVAVAAQHVNRQPSSRNKIYLCDVSSGAIRHTFDSSPNFSAPTIEHADFSPNGQFFAWIADPHINWEQSRYIHVCDIQAEHSDTNTYSHKELGRYISNFITFSADSNLVAYTSNSSTNTPHLWRFMSSDTSTTTPNKELQITKSKLELLRYPKLQEHLARTNALGELKRREYLARKTWEIDYITEYNKAIRPWIVHRGRKMIQLPFQATADRHLWIAGEDFIALPCPDGGLNFMWMLNSELDPSAPDKFVSAYEKGTAYEKGNGSGEHTEERPL